MVRSCPAEESVQGHRVGELGGCDASVTMVECTPGNLLMSGEPRDDDDDADRAAILRRRAVFVVSTLAGLGLAPGCGDDVPPFACLSPKPAPQQSGEASATADATVTTDAGPPDADQLDAGATDAGQTAAGSTHGADAGASADAGPPDAGPGPRPVPRPCLTGEPKPMPCLNF